MRAGILLILLLTACGGAPATPRAQDYIEEYGGSVVAIEAILAETDCGELAATFDAANANANSFGVATERGSEQRGRMAAADDRLDALGC